MPKSQQSRVRRPVTEDAQLCFFPEIREKRQRLRRWRETSNLENISTTTWKVRKKIRGRILGRNGDKSLRVAIHSHLFPSPLCKSGLNLVCNVNIVYKEISIGKRCNGTAGLGYLELSMQILLLGQLAIVSALSTPNGGEGYNSSTGLNHNHINTAPMQPSFKTTSSQQNHKQTATEILYVSTFSSSTSILYLYL
jgi:hypothetical protein